MTHPYRLRSTRKGNATELRKLERELADDVARADVESFGEIIPGEGEDTPEQFRNCWYLRPGREESETRDFDRGVRYLELRGLLERHPDDADLVRPKKETAQ